MLMNYTTSINKYHFFYSLSILRRTLGLIIHRETEDAALFTINLTVLFIFMGSIEIFG